MDWCVSPPSPGGNSRPDQVSAHFAAHWPRLGKDTLKRVPTQPKAAPNKDS